MGHPLASRYLNTSKDGDMFRNTDIARVTLVGVVYEFDIVLEDIDRLTTNIWDTAHAERGSYKLLELTTWDSAGVVWKSNRGVAPPDRAPVDRNFCRTDGSVFTLKQVSAQVDSRLQMLPYRQNWSDQLGWLPPR